MFKNKGIFFDLSLWDDFVSNLLYPAILGSLIYDFLIESNCPNSSGCVKRIFLGFTILFYFVDYFYMHCAFKVFKHRKCRENHNNKIKVTRTQCMIWLDFIDTISFAEIIFLINKSRYDLIIYPIFIVFIVEKLYFKDQITNVIENWFRIILLSFYFYFYWLICMNLYICCRYFACGYVILIILYATKANSFYKEEYPKKRVTVK